MLAARHGVEGFSIKIFEMEVLVGRRPVGGGPSCPAPSLAA